MSLKSVLANLGFFFQMSAMFILLPIILAFYYRELQPLVSFFITATIFFALGFILNAFFERKILNLKSSAILLSIVFFLISAVGTIPYMYNGIFSDGSLLTKFSNSYFESVSGYTTTGFTLIQNTDSLPKSLIFYRATTEWVGGISIVFLLLAFFYPEGTISHLLKLIGVERIMGKLKRVMVNVIFVYVFYSAILSFFMYVFVAKDPLNVVSLIFTTLSTGGFSPTSSILPFLSHGGVWILGLAMILGATNFLIHQKIIQKKFSSIFVTEFIFFIIILGLATLIFWKIWHLDLPTAFFHVVSASTTTGHSFTDLSKFSDNMKLALTTLMFIGGMSLSTAGGIKVWRVIFLLKTIPWAIRQFETNKEEAMYLEVKKINGGDILVTLFIPIIFAALIFASVFIFLSKGYQMIDSLFEITSAITATGLSTGITGIDMALRMKWVMILLMVLGRIEVIPLLVALTPAKIKRIK